ncbi:MAG: metallopeptidase TldD-related protein, partial [Candidatus Helarchaeales archaeon]
AEAVQYHRSYLTDKLNQAIGIADLDVVDDGTLMLDGMAALGTSPFDGEGTPKKKMPIVQKGILVNFLYDSYTAGKENKESTGNAHRAGYSSTPYISANNLKVIPKSSKTLQGLISESENAILVYTTGDQPNTTTGDFSGLIMTGFKISKGEIEHPIKQAMLGIHMIDFLKNIEIIGGDVRDLGRFHCPSMKISSAKIAGEG